MMVKLQYNLLWSVIGIDLQIMEGEWITNANNITDMIMVGRGYAFFSSGDNDDTWYINLSNSDVGEIVLNT